MARAGRAVTTVPGSEPLPPVAPGIFTGDGDATRLLGSRCPACDRLAWPPRDRCPDDGTATTTIELPPAATVYAATIVRLKPPFGLPAPYAVGYVDLDGVALRVFALLDPAVAAWPIGTALHLTSGPLGTDLAGAPCRRPYFRLA